MKSLKSTLVSELTFGFELEGFFSEELINGDEDEKISYEYLNYCKQQFPTSNHSNFVGDGSLSYDFDSELAKRNTFTCQTCDGVGYITCDECCNGIYNGNICNRCEGVGFVTCHSCEGAGAQREYSGEYDGYSFEWRSPVLKPTPQTLSKVIKFLQKSVKEYIEVNDSCGFHIHIGLPEKSLTKSDRLWVICQLALDEEMFKKITNYKGIELYNSMYSSLNSLKLLGRKLNSLKQMLETEKREVVLYTLKSFANEDKYIVLRQHPQGTLEWRGPRGFLNSGNKDDIRGFFLDVFYPFVKWIAKAYDNNNIVVNGVTITRKEFNFVMDEGKNLFPKLKRFLNMLHRFSRNNGIISTFISRVPSVLDCKLEDMKISIEDGIPTMSHGYFNHGIIDGVNFDGEATIQNIKRDDRIIVKNCVLNNTSIRNGTFVNCTFINCDIDNDREHKLNLATVNTISCNIRINGERISDCGTYRFLNNNIM